MLNPSRIIGQGLILAGLLGCLASVNAQSNTWVRKNDVAYNGQDGPRIGTGACAFGIGEKGYVVGSGNSLWEYDPALNAWSARAPFPGTGRSAAACFSIGGKGYVSIGAGLQDTWEYDPVDNSWTSKAVFPGQARTAPVGFAIAGKGYVGTGYNSTSNSYLNDFWEFDPVANTWTQKADFSGPGRRLAAAFAVGGKGYIGAGIGLFNGGEINYSDFREYDPATNVWTQRANLVPQWGMAGFALLGKGYVAGGASGASASSSLLEFNPVANTWTLKGQVGDASGRASAFAFATSTHGYFGAGYYYGNHVKYYNDFWAFDPVTSLFTSRQYLGGMAMQNASAFGIGAKGYFIAGSRYNELAGQETWTYVPSTNGWQKSPNVDQGNEASAAFTIGNAGYKVTGYGFVNQPLYDFHGSRVDAGTGTWSGIANLNSRGSAVGFSASGKGYVGLGTNGTNKNDLWQYDPTANAWTQKASFPGAARNGAVAFRVGNRVYVGTGMSTSLHRDMWMYDPGLNTWTQKADFGGTARKGAVAFTLGGKGYIATGDDGTKRNDLWEYDPVADTWTQKADFTGTPRSNAIAFVVGSKAYLGTGATGATTSAYDMWEYTAVDDASAVQVRPKVLLEGPFNSGTGLMNDALRTAGLVPLTEPYTALGYEHAMSGGESTTPAVLATTGNNAIVDWVVVELRHSAQPSLVVASACALVQRDGDVVATDGVSPVRLYVGAGNYHVAIRHRNHLGAMTANAIALTPAAITVDLTASGTATYGTSARKAIGSAQVLWAGDATRDNSVRYTGSGNDRDPILVKVGGTTPNSTVAGYFLEDVNLDGLVKYTGGSNDRDPILVNVGSTQPNNIREEQLP